MHIYALMPDTNYDDIEDDEDFATVDGSYTLGGEDDDE